MNKDGFSTVAVIGLGYVGLPLAVEFAKKGISVVGIDVSNERVKSINNGVSYVEDVSSVLLKELVSDKRIQAFSNFAPIERADAVVVCVPTPLTDNKIPDISYIVSAIKSASPYIKNGKLIVLESTTYPGTTEEVVLPLLIEKGLTPGKDFYLAFSPERIDPGNKKYHLGSIPKVVGGIDEASTRMASILYKMIVPYVFEVSSPRAAEMTKLLENTFRLVNIALVDELAMLTEKMDIDIWEVIEAAKTKPYGFMPFYPGPGVGGHCIPIDPFYLLWKAKEYDVDISFIELAGKVINSMPEYAVNKVSFALNSIGKPIKGSKILIIGVAYKKDISDTRKSPAKKIFEKLVEWEADISYYDPYVSHFTAGGKDFHSIPELTEGDIKNSDCVVILTAHSNIDYEMVSKSASVIVDFRNAIKGKAMNLFKLGG